MEMWDIYDENKKRTGRTMKKNDWCLKEGEYHLTCTCRNDRSAGSYNVLPIARRRACGYSFHVLAFSVSFP